MNVSFMNSSTNASYQRFKGHLCRLILTYLIAVRLYRKRDRKRQSSCYTFITDQKFSTIPSINQSIVIKHSHIETFIILWNVIKITV